MQQKFNKLFAVKYFISNIYKLSLYFKNVSISP